MKKRCLYCGNHQTSHIEHYLSHTLSAITPEFLRKWPLKKDGYIERLALGAYFPLKLVLRLFSIYRWQNDPLKALTGRSRVIWREAERRGIPMLQLVLFSVPVEFYCAQVNSTWQYFPSIPIPSSLEAGSYLWMDDKFRLKKFLQTSNIPVAAGDMAWTRKQALGVFSHLKKPVIVKPRSGTHGRHSVTNIRTESECTEAYAIASMLCQCVIVEEHLIGSVYRATYVNGKVVGILRGDPPRITGDGVSMLRELVAAKNSSRPEGVSEFVIDQKCTDFIARQGLNPESVLESGRVVDLSEKIGLSYGGYTAEILEKTHPKLLKILKQAGDLLEAPVIGFDFIIEDAEKDPDIQTWGIIEANSQPFIDLHYNPLEGPSINVAAAVWDLWEGQK